MVKSKGVSIFKVNILMMIIWCFIFLSTLFKSYYDDGRVSAMKSPSVKS